MELQTGRVVAVSLGYTSGVPKYPQEQIVIGPLGVEGDYHAGPVNKHKKKADPEPNRRQVSLVAQEVLDDLNASLGTHLRPGSLGENVLLEGLGDLSQLREGDRLRLGDQVVLEITGQNRPCATIGVYHTNLVKEITGRRGVVAVVVSGGVVRPGDRCMVLRPQVPATPPKANT